MRVSFGLFTCLAAGAALACSAGCASNSGHVVSQNKVGSPHELVDEADRDSGELPLLQNDGKLNAEEIPVSSEITPIAPYQPRIHKVAFQSEDDSAAAQYESDVADPVGKSPETDAAAVSDPAISAPVGETLEQAWATALAVDQSLQATRWGTSAAQQGLCAAEAEYMPSMSVTSTYNAMDEQLALTNPLPIPGVTGIPFSNREFVTAGVSITQPIFTSGKITNAVDAASCAVKASQTDEMTTRLDVKLSVAETYVNVLRAQRAVEIAETALKSLLEHERIVGRLVEEGVVVRNDLLAVEVQVADVRQALLTTQNTLDVARAAYNRGLGRPLSSPVLLDEVTEYATAGDVDTLTTQAMSGRPETAKLSALASSLQSQAESVRAGSLPQFFVLGGYNFGENRYFVDEAFTTVSVVGEWNLLDSGRNRHRSQQLQQTAQGLIRTRIDFETKIALQVRSAWLALQTAREKVAVNKAAIESAEENLRVSEKRYQQGTVTNTVVLDAITLRTGAYNLYYNSQYEVAIASLRLKRAIGSL